MLFDRPRTHPGQTDYKFPSAAAEGARDTLSGVAEGQRACESPINISLALARRLSLLPTSRLHAACARVRVFCMYYPGSAPKNSAPPSVRPSVRPPFASVVRRLGELLSCWAQSDSRSRETTTKDRSTGREREGGGGGVKANTEAE